jgi:nanoRNase/pAp phosphatase (c-di-AMP/oligoRNAs hydrolase)
MQLQQEKLYIELGENLTGYINKNAAEALYTAISTDTGSFSMGIPPPNHTV